jgi:hypothetical protein
MFFVFAWLWQRNIVYKHSQQPKLIEKPPQIWAQWQTSLTLLQIESNCKCCVGIRNLAIDK